MEEDLDYHDPDLEFLSFQDLISPQPLTPQDPANREPRQVVKRSRSRRRDRSSDCSGKWTKEEDALLKSLTADLEPDWDQVAAHFPNRHKSEVQRRWENCFDPRIKKTPWTHEEDVQILSLLSRFGSVWKRIAKHMDGRPPDHIKNRYYGHLKTTHMAPKPKIEEGEKQWEDPDIYIVQSEQETAKPKKPLNPALANILAMLKSSVQKMENDLSDARKKINNLDSELAANLKAKLETPIKTDPGL